MRVSRLSVEQSTRQSKELRADADPNGVLKYKKAQQINGVKLLSELALVNSGWLSPQLVDALVEAHKDWISLLQHNSDVELYHPSLPTVSNSGVPLKCTYTTLREFVPLTLKDTYQPIRLAHNVQWTYTFCVQVIGFGRSRLVVSFNNPQLTGNYVTFITNRLDWSPRKIILQWARHHTPADFYREAIAAPKAGSSMMVC